VHKKAHIQHRCRTKCQRATGLLLPSSSLPPPATVKKKTEQGKGWIRGWGNREGLLFAGED